MLVPINTDAPIYHFPWATLGLIIANIFTFALTGGGTGVVAPYFWLEIGNGLHPEEWLLCNFVHFGFIHIIINMVFLWGFGIIIEGKLGWWRFLLVYLGIGILHSAVLQLLLLFSAPGPVAGGASGIIFGLLAMAVVWAPKNELTCVLLILYRGIMFDISILTFSIYFIGLQFAFVMMQVLVWHKVLLSSEVIHVFGAVTGFVVGLVMLKQNWVDCENWDLLAVMRGTYGNQMDPDEHLYRQKSKHARKLSSGELPMMPGDEVDPLDEFARAEMKLSHKTRSLRKIRNLLTQGRTKAALSEMQRMERIVGPARLDRAELKTLAEGLYSAKDYIQAIPLMEEYCERFPEKAQSMRLKLASVLIEAQRRPRHALRVLEAIPPDPSSGKFEQQRKQMIDTANQMIEEGVIELGGNT